jgi:hypothetical protein
MRSVIRVRWLMAMFALLMAGGCMASGWMGGKASEPSRTERIEHHVEVNLRRISLSVPAGGRAFASVDPGPLIVPRTKEDHLKPRSIFTREYGKSESLGKDIGAFRISLDVVSLPRKLPRKIEDSPDKLANLIASVEKNPSEKAIVLAGNVQWVFEDVPEGIFGHLFLYTRQLDDDVLITVWFVMDRDRMQSDPAWLTARRRDIDTVLRSVVIE